MQDYIPISTLNDFIFCPYSIYLHNIYMDMDDSMYHALPKQREELPTRQLTTKPLIIDRM